MSHNSLLVDGAGGNREGSITTSATAIAAQDRRISIGEGANEADYDTSPAAALDGSVLYFYDAAPVNNITGASLTSSGGWVSAVTLPAGTYRVTARFSVTFSASGRFAYQLFDGSSSLGTRAQIGATLQFSTEPALSVASAVVTLAAATTLTVVSASGSTNLDSLASQGSTPSKESSWIVSQLL